MVFVNRERELALLEKEQKKASAGNGRVVVIEGSAGMGKTALVEEFIKRVNVEAKIARAREWSQFHPYSLIEDVLGRETSVKRLSEEYSKMRIEEIARKIENERGLIAIYEEVAGDSWQIFEHMSKDRGSLALLVSKPRRKKDIWLTGISTSVKSVNPENLEFEVTGEILNILESTENYVVFIDDLNYLIYVNGIKRVVDFLTNVEQAANSRKHLVLLGMRAEFLKDEETKAIESLTSKKIVAPRSRENKREIGIFFESAELCKSEARAVFTSPEGHGDYVVGNAPLDPHRIYFELFEAINSEIKSGNVVVLDCLSYLIQYNDIRNIYVWLKSVLDLGEEWGLKLYLTTKGLTREQIRFLAGSRVSSQYDIRKSSEAEEMMIYDSILNYLANEGNGRIFVFEDIQWADRSSMEAIKYIAREIYSKKMMLILTYRGRDIGKREDLIHVIEDTKMLPHSTFIRLRPMERDKIMDILSSIAQDVDDNKIKEIAEKSDGEPLLAITLLKYHSEGKYGAPETLRESIENIIFSLSDNLIEFLWTVSAIGVRVPQILMDKIDSHWRKKAEKIPGDILTMTYYGVEFKHGIYREIIYDSAPKEVRVEIHGKLGDMYNEIDNKRLAARHFYLGGRIEGIELLKELGDEALKNIAISDALEYYEMAVKLAKRRNQVQEMYSLIEKIAELKKMKGLCKEAVELYQELIENGRRKAANLARNMAECHLKMGEYDGALRILEEYFPKSEGIEHGRIAGVIGEVKMAMGNISEAQSYLEEYLKIAKKYNSKRDIARAYFNIAVLNYYIPNYNDVLDYAKKSLQVAVELMDYETMANAYNAIAVVYDNWEMIDKAVEYYEKSLEIANILGNYRHMIKVYNNLALLYEYYKGDIETSRKYYFRTLDLASKIGGKKDEMVSYYNLAILESRSGDLEKAMEYGRKSIELADTIEDAYYMCATHLIMSDLYYYLHEYEKSNKEAEKVIEIAKKNGYIDTIITGILALAEIYIEKKNFDEAKRKIEEAEGYLSNIDNVYSTLQVLELKVEFGVSSGDLEYARKYLKEAYSIMKETGIDDNLMFFQFREALILCKEGKYEKAVSMIAEVEEKMKSRRKYEWLGDLNFRFAECIKGKKREGAMKYYSKALNYYRIINNAPRAKMVEEKMKE